MVYSEFCCRKINSATAVCHHVELNEMCQCRRQENKGLELRPKLVSERAWENQKWPTVVKKMQLALSRIMELRFLELCTFTDQVNWLFTCLIVSNTNTKAQIKPLRKAFKFTHTNTHTHTQAHSRAHTYTQYKRTVFLSRPLASWF